MSAMTLGKGGGANDDAIEAWNTVLFDKFVRFRHALTVGLGSHGEIALARLAPSVGWKVLDVGCGFGDTTQRIAGIVGPSGEGVGVDCADNFVLAARREAAEAGITNARFLTADVQSDDLGGPYDAAFSRMGIMFFANPVQALRNIRRSLKAGAPFCAVVWRKKEDNDFLHRAEQIVEAIVPKPETHDVPTCGPGPFSMISADVVSEQFQKAGFRRVSFERLDIPINIGKSVDDAVEFALELGPAGELIRVAGEEGQKRRPQAAAALNDLFAQSLRPEGVLCPSSTWIISARAEG